MTEQPMPPALPLAGARMSVAMCTGSCAMMNKKQNAQMSDADMYQHRLHNRCHLHSNQVQKIFFISAQTTSSSTRNFLSSYASNLFVYASLSQNIYCTADCLYIMHCTCTGKSQIRQRDRRQNKTGGKQFERLSAN